MVMNLTSLKSIMKSVIDTMDHRNLDKDVEFFKLNPRYPYNYSSENALTFSTSENVAVYIWNEVNASLNASHKAISLYEVKVHETKHNVAIYRGE
jgi:6-pyruvoyltetrahydropterin/6-carboxytetrahydropterin synthase